MTVAELKIYLDRFPPDLKVVQWDDGDLYEITAGHIYKDDVVLGDWDGTPHDVPA